MSTFDKKDLQRFAVSTVGAIILATTCVVAAVGPVHAADYTKVSTSTNLLVAK